jgi:membrane-associated phospholipid phosphatase
MTMLTHARDSVAAAVTATALGVVTLVVLVRVALNTSQGQSWDESAMDTVTAGRDAQLTLLSMLGYISIGAVIVVVGVCVAIALARGRIKLAAAAVAVIAGSNVTTQVLKRTILEREDFGLGTLNSLPSGHTTVVASAVGAVLLVAPAISRPVLALAGGFATTFTGASTVVAGWHRPSDVIAALAVSLIWTAGMALIVKGRPQPVGASLAGAVAGCVGALLFLVAIGVRPVMGWDGFTHSALVLGLVTAATAVFVVAATAASPAE